MKNKDSDADKLKKAIDHTNSLPDAYFGNESASKEDLPKISTWQERHAEALANAADGEHAWFQFKDDPFNSCAKCGVIERKDHKNSPCKGKTKITLR